MNKSYLFGLLILQLFKTFTFQSSNNVRLVGGRSFLEGRVEVRYNGAWGTVCDDGWDNTDAGVICSMLGFSRSLSVARNGGYFPAGSGTIFLDDVNCVGSELSISDCNHRGWRINNCGHSEDAGVTCILHITNDDVRLIGGRSGLEGRVEIKYKGAWGTVCDDEWDNNDAGVVCSMLGYSRAQSVARQGGYFPSGTGRILLDNVNCVGRELSISNCTHNGWTANNCRHHEDAGVTCSTLATNGCGSADILFILDDSGSVGPINFREMKKFVKNLIKGFTMGQIRFGAITYSLSVKKNFNFGDYSSLSSILSAVEKISYSSGIATNTDKAIRYARESIFTSYGRHSVKIAILVTDGQSSNPKYTATEAANLRKLGVRIFSIGVGGGPNRNELNAIASDPPSDHVFIVKSFSILNKVRQAVARRTCEATVDGGFSEWSPWSSCTATCNGGNKSRNRTCTNPVPSSQGRNCTGQYRQTTTCQELPCPVDGGFTDWSTWSVCSVTCGNGERRQYRNCINPRPRHGGRDCLGRTSKGKKCNAGACPVDGGFSLWSGWSRCSVTCGGGFRKRYRSCTMPTPAHGGSDCIGPVVESDTCGVTICPVHGEFSDWSEWTPCSKSCGTGTTFRSRFCSNPSPSFGGRNCVGENRQEIKCEIVPCPVDGGFTDWSTWSVCSVTCGNGVRRQYRDCTNPRPRHGGRDCLGRTRKGKKCNAGACPVDGGFSLWSRWSRCSVTCGGGFRKRYRSCTMPMPAHGGSDCIGPVVESDTCGVTSCPVHGRFGDWSEWTPCSKSCGTGTTLRSRFCSNPSPSFGGRNCVGESRQEIKCEIVPCPVDGGYTDWNEWSICSVSCGTGQITRNRSCTNPTPAFGGNYCNGSHEEVKECLQTECPVDGGFSSWGMWSQCSRTCRGGMKSRHRVCNNPTPMYGGRNCSGDVEESNNCNIHPCPVHGGFSEWEAWSICSVSCGGGYKTRTRTCSDPSPIHGGRPCRGHFSETLNCNMEHCPVDGGVSNWSSWSACSRTCGTSTSFRKRFCTNPVPQYGGKNCSEILNEEQNCKLSNCPIHGKFSEWSSWSECSKTCNGGFKSRSRKCDSPEPKHGGNDCSGRYNFTISCNTRPCPINGGFSDWSTWLECSVSCGGGTRQRGRSCTNPEPMHGGLNCSGDVNEVAACNKYPCPIDGRFSDWSMWTTCSKSCGGGMKSRQRLCNNPTPMYGGRNCSGDAEETNKCNSFPCPVHGGFSEWETWSVCSVSCGGGYKTRTRTCSDPSPSHGGRPCQGHFSETFNCNMEHCPVDGGVSNWSSWSVCTRTCGTGSSFRKRFCTNPIPQYGGKNCSEILNEEKTCKLSNCPIHGKFSEWSSWSECTKTCNGGFKSKSRKCDSPKPKHGGNDCSGRYSLTIACNTRPCPINGGFSKWSTWLECSVTCGGGTRRRGRSCSNPMPMHGGLNCSGDFFEVAACGKYPCPIDGNFSDWSMWTTCSKSCGGGIKTRKRKCDNPSPLFGGMTCVGNFVESLNCNTFHCPIHGGFAEWETWSKCTVSCGGGTSKRYRSCSNPFPRYKGNNCTGEFAQSRDCNLNHCPIDGGYSNWGVWSDCTRTCGIGSKIRDRICNSPKPQYGGRECAGESREILECNINPCPIDGKFGSWSDWSTCSSTCGGGNKNRSRVCNSPSPAFGGKNCSGSFKEQITCNILPCPIHGVFSEWSLWTECSKSCGDGYIERNRTCSNPSPQFGGSDCLGNNSETLKCNLRECPIHGKFSTWGEWSECTTSCGGGLTVRQRFCSDPEPRYGGDNCSGSFHERSRCNENPCPINGGYSSWSSWTNCDVSCGGGTSLRRRTCSNPKPKFGGSNCSGSPLDSKQCSTVPCPIDGNFTSWGQWSECSVSCGGGFSTRERTCTNPRPAFGGKDCSGGKNETNSCNTQRCSICADGQFECADRRECIPDDYKCDGLPDCTDSSDEDGCDEGNNCPEGLYQCPNGECVSNQSNCQ